MKKLLVTVIFIAIIHSAKCINIDTIAVLKDIRSKETDIKINGLIAYSQYLYQVSNFYNKADSVANLAILESQMAENSTLFFYGAANYMKVCLPENVLKAETYLTRALETAIQTKNNDIQFLAYIHLTSLFTQTGVLAKGKETIQKALTFILDNKNNQAIYFLTLGDLQLKANEKISAYENFNNAILLSREIENDSLEFAAYNRLFFFYRIVAEYAKCENLLLQASKLIENNENFNVFDLMLLKSKLVDIYINSNQTDLALKIVDEVLPISEKNKFHSITQLIFGTLRANYLSNDKQKEICNLYCTKYPEELQRLKASDPKIYYRVQALIFENSAQIDSAKYYLQLAEEQTLQSGNAASIANFYKRKGQFYIRQHDMQAALTSFVSYFENAKKSLHFPFIIDAARLLDSLYYLNGDVATAYKFSKIKETYTDSNAAQTQKDKLLNIEIENMAKLAALEKEKQEYMQSKKANFQVVIIITCILFSIILLVVFSRYKISKGVLKLFSYVTFVLFFEFIIYLLDSIIHKWAHGEPLKIMAIKVVIISLLLPIHHATDYRVVQYLTRKNLVRDRHVTLRQWIANAWRNFMNWLNIHHEEVTAKATEKLPELPRE